MDVKFIPKDAKEAVLLIENKTDKPLNVKLDDGRVVTCKRKGLKITFAVGEATGEALMRRLEHGPDVKNILRRALEEAARAAGVMICFEDGSIWLEG